MHGICVPCAQIMAEVMGAEAAIMRIQFVSGTHAIATALFSVLRRASSSHIRLFKSAVHLLGSMRQHSVTEECSNRPLSAAAQQMPYAGRLHASCCRPGDELLAVAGKPYDTLEEVIGLRGTPGHGSLREGGVAYRELPLASSGSIDWGALRSAIAPSELCSPLLLQPAPLSMHKAAAACDSAACRHTVVHPGEHRQGAEPERRSACHSDGMT